MELRTRLLWMGDDQGEVLLVEGIYKNCVAAGGNKKNEIITEKLKEIEN